MARLRTKDVELPDELGATLELIIGPVDLTRAELELAWEVYGPFEQHRSAPSWGWWAFESGAGKEPDDPAERERLLAVWWRQRRQHNG